MQAPDLPVRQKQDRIQRLNRINASAEFIENACPLAVDSQYVPELDKFIPISEARSYTDTMWAYPSNTQNMLMRHSLTLWTDSNVERESLIDSINQLKQKSRRLDNSDKSVDLHEFTWRQVIAEVQNASNAYRSEGGRARSIFHRMCDNATIFENWLDILPNGDYGAVISGAFVMVLRASPA